jgi:hypothetical protein
MFRIKSHKTTVHKDANIQAQRFWRTQRYQPAQVYDRAQSNESELRVAPALSCAHGRKRRWHHLILFCCFREATREDNGIVLLLSDLVWGASSQFRSGATGVRPFGGRTAEHGLAEDKILGVLFRQAAWRVPQGYYSVRQHGECLLLFFSGIKR